MQLENLEQVIRQEKKERAAITENLKNFHKAIDKRENEIAAELDKNHLQRMKDLENQAALLKKLIPK